ncbi:hypothetical protein BN2497_2817 [Janthinobacterium sp. CG23_2]|nr:hypothetical protein BN2497_2817 [Janthinobacterium sp. CG23_2]CUU27806.1 hypothetical protein BN3177_2817 [Janthinobacterium sp. CG23_2]
MRAAAAIRQPTEIREPVSACGLLMILVQAYTDGSVHINDPACAKAMGARCAPGWTSRRLTCPDHADLRCFKKSGMPHPHVTGKTTVAKEFPRLRRGRDGGGAGGWRARGGDGGYAKRRRLPEGYAAHAGKSETARAPAATALNAAP